MICAVPEISAYIRQFQRQADRTRTPLFGHADITGACNYGCRHCYYPAHAQAATFLDADLALRTWRAAADLGCLFLLLSGGEPLLHPQFHAIYRTARELGLLVTVFTNASLIDASHVALFRDLPPRMVEASIYGASDESAARITGVRDSLSVTLAGVDRLLAAGIEVRLKTVLMRANAGELERMQAIAATRGVRFRFDPAISPRLDGDPAPLAERLDADAAVAAELADPARLTSWHEFLARDGVAADRDRLYTCGAGLTSFYLGPAGILQPCLMVDRPAVDLADHPFAEGWAALAAVQQRLAPADFRCRDCDLLPLCSGCPGEFRLESGSEAAASDYQCALATARRTRLQSAHAPGDPEPHAP